MSIRLPKPDIHFPFFVSLAIYIIISIFNKTFYGQYIPGAVFQASLLACISLLFFHELAKLYLTEYHLKEILHLLAVCAFFAICTRFLGFKTSMLLIYIYCSRDIDFKRTANLASYTAFAMFCFVVLSALLGIIHNYVSVGSDGRIREYLGFTYALPPAMILANVTALQVYVKKDCMPLTQILFWAVLNTWLFSKTDSRLSYFTAMFFLILAFLFRINLDWTRIFEKFRPLAFLTAFAFIICMTASILIIAFYDKNIDWMRRINDISEERIVLTIESIKKFGISLFGEPVKWVGNGLDSSGNALKGQYLYVDNIYINLIQRAGIIAFAYLTAILTVAMIKTAKAKDYWFLVIWAVLSCRGILDDLIIGLHYNTFWLGIGAYIYSSANNWKPSLQKLILKKLAFLNRPKSKIKFKWQ